MPTILAVFVDAIAAVLCESKEGQLRFGGKRCNSIQLHNPIQFTKSNSLQFANLVNEGGSSLRRLVIFIELDGLRPKHGSCGTSPKARC